MKKRLIVITYVVLLTIIGIVTAICLMKPSNVNTLINQTIKPNSNNASQQSVDLSNTITGNEENDLIQAISSIPTNQYVGRNNSTDKSFYQLYIYFHKAYENDKYYNHFGDDDCYKVYYLHVITNDMEQIYDKATPTEKWVLRLRNVDKYYQIDISPTEQRELLQKILDDDILSLDNPVPEMWFSLQYRYREKDAPGATDYDLSVVDFKGITIIDYTVWDGTPKNKTAIDNYLSWFEGKYQAELLKNQVDEWTDDPTGKYAHPAEGW